MYIFTFTAFLQSHHYTRKKTLTLLISLFFFFAGQATIKTAVGNSAQGWATASNWSPAGVPQPGDEVIIPASFTISVKGAVYGSPFPALTIKIYGTLDFDPSGKIDLATASIINVYGLGQIISSGTSSELININGISKFNGQLDGTISGPRYATSGTGTSPNGFDAGVLAIKISAFSYKLINQEVKLSWTATHDNPADKFEVQRNAGSGWVTRAEILAGGNMNILNDYSYTDSQPVDGINLYRIKLVNANVGETYSKTVSVSLLTGIESVSAFPNPAREAVIVTWKANGGTDATYIQVNNASMHRVLYKQIPAGENSFYLDLSRYPSGLYTVTVTTNNRMKETVSLVVNH